MKNQLQATQELMKAILLRSVVLDRVSPDGSRCMIPLDALTFISSAKGMKVQLKQGNLVVAEMDIDKTTDAEELHMHLQLGHFDWAYPLNIKVD